MRSAVELDLHMQVAPETSVIDAHRLASRIENDLKLKFPELSDVVIHIEPTPPTNPTSPPPGQTPLHPSEAPGRAEPDQHDHRHGHRHHKH
jgi:hypothetical protein